MKSKMYYTVLVALEIAAILGFAIWYPLVKVKPVAAPVTVEREEYHGTARASWYGRYFHGRTTRYGERYDMNGLTTACNLLPKNTRLLVTNLANGKSVIVRVNDTGRFKTVYLDMSRGAFAAIADTNEGIITVGMKLLK